MRVNNSKARNVVISVYFFTIAITLVLSIVFNAFTKFTSNPALTFIISVFIFLAIFLLLFRTTKFFEYDSDGLKVGIMNKGLLSSEYLKYKEHTLEFEKEKLMSFKIQNFIIYKRLVLYIIGGRDHKKKEVFNVTLMERKKLKYVRQSLNKIIKYNRKQKSKVDDRR